MVKNINVSLYYRAHILPSAGSSARCFLPSLFSILSSGEVGPVKAVHGIVTSDVHVDRVDVGAETDVSRVREFTVKPASHFTFYFTVKFT